MPAVPTRYWVIVFSLGFVWGTTFLLIELALRGISPGWLAASRITFGAVVLVAIWGWRGFKLFEDKTDWPSLIFVGIFSTVVPFWLISWGQQHVTSSFSGTAMASVALMILPLAHFFVPDERMNLRKVIGFGLGFAGVVILIGGNLFDSTGSDQELLGRLALIAAPVGYAFSSIAIRRMPAINAYGLAAGVMIVGACISLPLAFFTEGPPKVANMQTLWVIAALGLLHTAIANLLRIIAVRGAGPTFMSLVSYQVPVWSVLMGAWVLNEPLPGPLLIALALILSGMVISQLGALKRLLAKTAA